MSYEFLEVEQNKGLATLWLNRPDRRNALNDALVAELSEAVSQAIADPAVRVLMLAGRGKVFCAGADLNKMDKPAEAPAAGTRPGIGGLGEVMRQLYECRKPTVARVHGPAFAGGMGLVSACDISIASAEAKFCLSEVKIGLIPAMISPYVIKRIGEAQARRFFLTAEVFGAADALRIGFVSALAEPDAFDAKVDEIVGQLLLGAPLAMGECKQLIHDVAGRPIDDALTDDTAARIQRMRGGAEAKEGIAAFFEKRKPNWVS